MSSSLMFVKGSRLIAFEITVFTLKHKLCYNLNVKYNKEDNHIYSKDLFFIDKVKLVGKIYYILKSKNVEMHFKDITKELNKFGFNYQYKEEKPIYNFTNLFAEKRDVHEDR